MFKKETLPVLQGFFQKTDEEGLVWNSFSDIKT